MPPTIYNTLRELDNTALDAKIGVGVVQNYFYGHDYYLVSGPGTSGTPIEAVSLQSTGFRGVAGSDSYPIGSTVFYVYFKSSNYGFILGSWAAIRNQASGDVPSFYDLALSATKLVQDRPDGNAHTLASGILFPSNIPRDAFAKVTPTGGAILLNNDSLIVRANPSTGIEATTDGMLSLNADIFNSNTGATSTQEYQNKDGVDFVRHVYKSANDGLGFAKKEDLADAVADEVTKNELDANIAFRDSIPTVSTYEGDSAEGRVRLVRGYIQDGEDRDDKETGVTVKTHVTVPLFKEVLGKDGSYRLQSATEISIEKYGCISDMAVARKDSEEPIETPESAFYYNNFQEAKSDSGYGSIGIYYHAWLFEKLLPEKFSKRWTKHTAVEVKDLLGLDGATFKKNNFRDLPNYIEVLIDAQTQAKKRIYGSRSGIYLHDDGSITIEDGWGSQIVMSRGNITITPARDLHLRPGADIVGLVPGDVSILGAKSINLTSTEGGISLGAEQFVSINQEGTAGGILINSKSTAKKAYDDGKPSGIVLKSAGSVSTVSANYEVIAEDSVLSLGTGLIKGSSCILSFNSTTIYNKEATETEKLSDAGFVHIADKFYVSMDTELYKSSSFYNTLQVHGLARFRDSILCAGSGSFQTTPGALESSVVRSIKDSLDKAKTSSEANLESVANEASTDVASSYKLHSDMYLKTSNADNLRFVPAITRVDKYEFFETRWQQYNADSVLTITTTSEAIPAQVTTADFYVLTNKDNIDNTGLYQSNSSIPTADFVISPVSGKYPVSTGQASYKSSAYNKE